MTGNGFDFDTMEEAETFLVNHGFRLVPDGCEWINDAGIGAGIYMIETPRWPQTDVYRSPTRRDIQTGARQKAALGRLLSFSMAAKVFTRSVLDVFGLLRITDTICEKLAGRRVCFLSQ
jgi:hypothetical protein